MQITRVSQEFPSTSAHSGPNACRLYPDIDPEPRTARVASTASAPPAGGGGAAGGAVAVGWVAGADDGAEGIEGDVGAAGDGVTETVAVGEVGWNGAAAGAAPEPHPATPTAKPATRHANRPTRIWRIDLPLPPGTPCGAGGAGDLRESIVRWTGGAGSLRRNLAQSDLARDLRQSESSALPPKIHARPGAARHADGTEPGLRRGLDAAD